MISYRINIIPNSSRYPGGGITLRPSFRFTVAINLLTAGFTNTSKITYPLKHQNKLII